MRFLRCPHCRLEFSDDDSLAGEFQCPSCGGVVRKPRELAVAGEVLPPPFPFERPSVVVVTPRADKRLASHGWFARSFVATLGVATALVAVVVLLCGGIVVALRHEAGRPARVEQMAIAEITPLATQQAVIALRQFNITDLSSGTRAVEDDGRVLLKGRARDRSGLLRDVIVVWTVGTFGTERVWQLEYVAIDKDIAFQRDGFEL